MLNDSNWIKLNRKILDWEWYFDINTKVLFLHLLLKASWEDNKYMGIEIKKGSLITGVNKLKAETHLSIQSIRTSLKKLQNTKEIVVKATNKFSMITIVNYEKYQKSENNQQTDNNQLTNNQQTTNYYIRNKEDISSNSSIKERARIYQFYEENFGVITSIEKEGLDMWLNEFNEEIVKYAIKISVLNNIKTFSYTNGTLRNWKAKEYKTLAECKPKEKVEENKPVELFDYNWLEEESVE